jgi:hypothetical protein
VGETTPREREIVAVLVAIGEIGRKRVADPLRETAAKELGEAIAIDENAGVEDAETVPAPPP